MATLKTMHVDTHSRSNLHGVSTYIDTKDLTAVLGEFTHIRKEVEPILATALLSGANVVLNAAKVKCPVRTGTLKRSIHAEVEGSGDTVLVGTDVSYARYVEMGTIKRDAKPYLLPALTENVGGIEKRVQNSIRKLTAGA